MFGYNRYAIVLLGMALAAGGAGCSGGGSGGGSASTVAPSTSTSPAATTTSGTSAALGTGPQLTTSRFLDVNGDSMINKGDKIVLKFDGALDQITGADPAAEFTLAVAGDSFGTGATAQNGSNGDEIEVVLGDNAHLVVSDAFDVARTSPGSASGINVSFTTTVRGFDTGTVRASATPLDIDGSLANGFRSAGSMNTARGGAKAITLDDGRVLVVGGAAAKGKNGYTGEPELYDPTTGAWTRVSDLTGNDGLMKRGKITVRMISHSATKLSDGTVLICGGYGVEKKGLLGLGSEKEDTLESAFIFDPVANTFSQVADMQYPRHSHTATLMADGRVLLAGGYNDSWWSKNKTQCPFEIYDPAKKAFEKIGSIFSRFKSQEGRMNHTATAIEGGNGILLTGGNRWEGGALFGLIKPKLKMNSAAEVVRGNQSDKTADLNVQRMCHSAAMVTPREVLIAGGYDPNGIHNSIELFDSATAAWTSKGNMATARTGCQIAVDKNKALIIGGTDGSKELDSVEVYDADAKSMSQSTYKLATARSNFAVATLKDGRILVIGGFTGATSLDGMDGQPIASAEIYIRQ
ncbi:MAG: kelch repeat-containing protein [Planctomycetota bacterium]